jgi:hypothetical protein
MKEPKVIIACPIAGVKQYSINQWLDWISLQDHSNFEILFCVNGNQKLKLTKKLLQIELRHKKGKKIKKINIIGLNQDKDLTTIQKLVYSREKIRLWTKYSEAEYLLFLDSDTIPVRKDFIKDQIKQEKQAITGVYYYKNSKVPVLINPKTKTNFTIEELEKYAETNKLAKGQYVGTGCLMLHRKIFEKIGFNYEKFGERMSDDFGYCEILERNKIPVWINARQPCFHIRNGKYAGLEAIFGKDKK